MANTPLNRDQKAQRYDDNIRIVEYLQREISKLKSEYVGNIPPEIQKKIDENTAKIAKVVSDTERLFL